MQAGSTVGAYRVVAKLGSGGMGDVYRAHDDRLGRDVALKILPAGVAAHPERLARFRREARAVAALNHPHIVTIFSIEEAHGVPFMTMELVEGRSLEHALAGGGLPLDRFFDIAAALADALSAAHRKGIVHRDLKPANVMVTDDGLVKVLDFGLARDTAAYGPSDLDVTSLGLTQAGIIVGTVPYMSPEQIEGKAVDHRSDIFSLGIVLYEMASGARPFGGDSSAALMSSILRDRPRPLTEIRADVPEGVSRLAARCLEKSPGDRAQSAQDIHAELRELRRAWESGASRLAGPAGRSTMPPRSTSSAIRSASADRVASIAVMPFADLSPAGDQEWFCDGVAEEILNALTPFRTLRVAARASAFSLRGSRDDLRTIGEKLSVTTVLGGSVRRAGDRVRITVQLSEVETGFQLWSERYEREVNDIFEIQDDIAAAVAARLKVTLADSPLDRLARLVERGTTNIDAYQLYLQGRALLTRRGGGIGQALELFERAVTIDPTYSVAWAAIAEAHTVLAYFGMVRGAESKPHAIAAASRAIELSPSSAAGHAALACAVLAYANDRVQAKHAFDRALALNPHYVQGRCWYALFYLQWVAGEFDEGLAHARRALEDDPLSAYATMIVAACLATAGRLDQAIEMGRLAMERDPESYVARWQLGVVLIEAGRLEEAIALLETAPAPSANTLELVSLAFAYQQAGRHADAAAVHDRVLGRAAERYVAQAYLALSAAAAGRLDDAMSHARAAWDDREPPFILFARHFPHWRPLHADPRMQAILCEMNAPAEDAR